MSSDEKINVMLILNIIGKPKEYLVESLEKHVSNLEKEGDVVMKSKDIKKPELMKGEKEFYSTFAEVEIEVEDVLTLVALMFQYMPSHVEIISPEMIGMTNNIFNDMLNELVRRLHSYDELARVMQSEKQILINKIQELGGEIPQGIMPLATLRDPFEKNNPDPEPGKEKK